MIKWKGLEPVDLTLAARKTTKGLCRVLELDVLEFRVLWVEAAELVKVHWKVV